MSFNFIFESLNMASIAHVTFSDSSSCSRPYIAYIIHNIPHTLFILENFHNIPHTLFILENSFFLFFSFSKTPFSFFLFLEDSLFLFSKPPVESERRARACRHSGTRRAWLGHMTLTQRVT